MNTLPYPPPWMDAETLAAHLCCSSRTLDAWVLEGILPHPRKVRGKLMWKWSEVDNRLTNFGVGKSAEDPEAERIRNGTRAEAASH